MSGMMLRVDPTTRDLAIEDGDIATITGAQAVAQAVRATLLVYKGEWMLDTRHGVDYARIHADEAISDQEIDHILRAAIYQESAVKHIDALSIIRKGRAIEVSFVGRIASGESLHMEVTL